MSQPRSQRSLLLVQRSRDASAIRSSLKSHSKLILSWSYLDLCVLVPSELSQLKLLGEAHRISPAIARRVRLIEVSQRHPNWSTKQLAQALHRHGGWVRKWRRRWHETRSLTDAPRSGAPRQFSPKCVPR